MLKSLIYLIISLATMFFALPRLDFFSSSLEVVIFGAVWMFFALIIVGAHLDHLLILDEDKRNRMKQLKRYKLWKKQQKILAMHSNDFKKATHGSR